MFLIKGESKHSTSNCDANKTIADLSNNFLNIAIENDFEFSQNLFIEDSYFSMMSQRNQASEALMASFRICQLF